MTRARTVITFVANGALSWPIGTCTYRLDYSTAVFRPIEFFLKWKFFSDSFMEEKLSAAGIQNASIVATKLVEQDMTWDLLENQMRLEGATAVREVLTQIGLSVGTSLRLVTLLDSNNKVNR